MMSASQSLRYPASFRFQVRFAAGDDLSSYDRENRVSGHFEYAFLLDECVMHLVTRFPKGRAKTIADFCKRGAADPQVVALVHADGRIIVTNNSRDYRSEMKTFAKRWGNDKCSDLSGPAPWKSRLDAFSVPDHDRCSPYEVSWNLRRSDHCPHCVRAAATAASRMSLPDSRQ